MKFKYLDIQDKMERSRKLLQNAQDRIERQEQVRRTVANLRQKADLYQSKLNMQKLLKESGGAMPDSECGGMPDIIGGCSGFDFPEPIINYEEEERQQDDDEATKSGMCFKNQYFTMCHCYPSGENKSFLIPTEGKNISFSPNKRKSERSERVSLW